jgi:hypothetical protein
MEISHVVANVIVHGLGLLLIFSNLFLSLFPTNLMQKKLPLDDSFPEKSVTQPSAPDAKSLEPEPDRIPKN